MGFRQSQAQRGAADPRLPGLRGQPLATRLGQAGFRLCTVASLHASSAGFAVAPVAGPVLTAVPSLRLPALPTSSTPRRDPFYTLPLPFFLPSSPLFPSPYLSLPRPLSLFCFLLPLSLPLCHLYLCLLRCSVWLWLFLLVAGRCVLACCLADGPAAGPFGLPEGAPLLVLVVPGKAFGTVVWQQPEIPRHPTGPLAEQCDLEQEVVMATGLRCAWEHKFINL